MHPRALLLPVVFAASTTFAEAQEPREAAPRYAFVPVEGGALRLNTGTGEVSLCGGADGAGACRPLPDAANGSRDEVAALRGRIAALEARIDALEARGAAGEQLSAESMDRVMVLADRMMRSFFGLVRDLKEDLDRGEL